MKNKEEPILIYRVKHVYKPSSLSFTQITCPKCKTMICSIYVNIEQINYCEHCGVKFQWEK